MQANRGTEIHCPFIHVDSVNLLRRYIIRICSHFISFKIPTFNSGEYEVHRECVWMFSDIEWRSLVTISGEWAINWSPDINDCEFWSFSKYWPERLHPIDIRNSHIYLIEENVFTYFLYIPQIIICCFIRSDRNN